MRWVWMVLLIGCSADTSELVVFFQTDLVHGREVTSVSATWLRDGLPQGSFEYDEPGDYLEGVRIGSWETGDGVARVQMVLRNQGRVLGGREALVDVQGDTAVTIVFFRRCLESTCPRAGDDPAATECLGDRCVRPECTPENPDACDVGSAPGECTCPTDLPDCVEGRCVAGQCLLGPRDRMCGDGICDRTAGCVEASPDSGLLDATAPDAGQDASSDATTASDATAADAGCPGGCPTGQLCNGGICVGSCSSTCADGLTCCGGGCFDLQSSGLHCGSCGNDCAGAVCGEGTCTFECGDRRCDPTEICCNNSCVDPRQSILHCGFCGNDCPSGVPCTNGTCIESFTCNPPCTGDNVCVLGECQCSGSTCGANEDCCGGICINVQSTPTHCGRCGNACDTRELCERGQCQPGIKTCSPACGAGETCNDGQCECGLDGVCAAGESCCSASCVNTNIDPNNCGGCGSFCSPQGDRCIGGNCMCGDLPACATFCTGGSCFSI